MTLKRGEDVFALDNDDVLGMVSKPKGQVQKTGKAIAKGFSPALDASRMQWGRHDEKHLPFGF